MGVRFATKFAATIVGVLALATFSSGVGLVSAYHFRFQFERSVVEHLESVRAAEELEIALLEQRGYASAYMLDGGNRAWLDELAQKRQAFGIWLMRARDTAHTSQEGDLLNQLEVVYASYENKRDEVIALYDSGQMERATALLLGEMTDGYVRAYDLCEEFIATNDQYVNKATATLHAQINRMTWLITASAITTLVLGAALLWLFFRGLILPLRRMAADARSFATEAAGGLQQYNGDELREVGHHLRVLMTDVTETRSDLERSRGELLQAEKLASVGKLAASVAHEIRNPLTAMKMWLFSLRKSAGQEAESARKFDLVSDEIERLEKVVESFLEFSRPPKLERTLLYLPELIDKTLDLLAPRLAERRIHVSFENSNQGTEISADPGQLKQVLINLLMNAIEVTPVEGEIRIAIATDRDASGRRVAVVRIQDSGGGMSEDVKSRIFEPFFTTKEDGTGLGLCIAARIMARHGGKLTLESSNLHGTCFALRIPVEAPESHE